MTSRHAPAPIAITAADGYVLAGCIWQHEAPQAVVIINPATSVHSRYYHRFADYLYRHGFSVVTYDYRGIGASRPPRLRGFQAGWLEWGRLDFEAVLQYVAEGFAALPIQVAAHSVGGFVIGLAPSSHRISRIFTMGAQYAYWRDYAPRQRLRMLWKWHLVMPALTALLGYFPGKRLGWLEDTPHGVVREWVARQPRFEEVYRYGATALAEPERRQLVAQFGAIQAPTLAVSIADDEFGTPQAIQRLLAYYHRCPQRHLHIDPAALQQAKIGHFAFFHSRFEHSLWPIALAWLRAEALPTPLPGRWTSAETL